jgi:hypothetical protein
MTKYLLPCVCGRQLPVEAGQSGTALDCECGRTVDVPTMRELARLKTAKETQDPNAKPLWGWRQSIVFLGLLIVVGAVAFGAYMQFSRSKPFDYAALHEKANELQPADAWGFWRAFRDCGINLRVSEDMKTDPELVGAINSIRQLQYTVQRQLMSDQELLNWIYIAGGIAVIGGALIGVGAFWPSASRAPVKVKAHRARRR